MYPPPTTSSSKPPGLRAFASSELLTTPNDFRFSFTHTLPAPHLLSNYLYTEIDKGAAFVLDDWDAGASMDASQYVEDEDRRESRRPFGICKWAADGVEFTCSWGMSLSFVWKGMPNVWSGGWSEQRKNIFMSPAWICSQVKPVLLVAFGEAPVIVK